MAIKISEIIGKKIYTTKGIYVGEVFDALLNFEKSSVGGLVITDVNTDALGDSVDPSKKIVLPYGLFSAVGHIVLIKPIATGSISNNFKSPISY